MTKVWEVQATTNAIVALADHLAEAGIERVVVESTSDYWRPFFYLLEAWGLSVWAVNARDVKQVPGRLKTHKVDAVWLAKLNERGMLRPSFVPPGEIRHLRDYTGLRADLVENRTRHKPSPVASTTTTPSWPGCCSTRSTPCQPRSTC